METEYLLKIFNIAQWKQTRYV